MIIQFRNGDGDYVKFDLILERELEVRDKKYKDIPLIKLHANLAKCGDCEDIMHSTKVHEFIQCLCGNSFIDGGDEYFRYGGTPRHLFAIVQKYYKTRELYP